MSRRSLPATTNARAVLLLILIAVAVALFQDYRRVADTGEVRALRSAEPLSDGDAAGSVAPFCGFAPCGMPLEC